MRLGSYVTDVEDVDFDNRTITIRDRKDPNEKEGNDETIPMFHETDPASWSMVVQQQRGRIFCQLLLRVCQTSLRMYT